MKRWAVINKTTKQVVYESERYGDCESFIVATMSSLYKLVQQTAISQA